ncbi:MAG: YceI family protein [Phycisphaerales bacterium]|nr:YceI family protein [Phycisphaerales bacterium]
MNLYYSRKLSILLGGALWASLLSGRTLAAAVSFDFKDPKSVNTIAFILDSTLEPILGVASGISGTVSFDPANPKAASGKIVVQAKSLHIENKGMQDTLHGADWLDVEKHPTIEFAFKKVAEAGSPEKDVYELTVVGDLTCKGVTKEITVPVKATFLPGRLGERNRNVKGDLLVLRSNFVMKRTDFGLKPDVPDQAVANDIELRVSIVGIAPAK